MHQQRVTARCADGLRILELPAPSAEVLSGVVWGPYETFFTPAFWATRAWIDEPVGRFTDFRLGATLAEEVAACLLGGHGIPAEVGIAAFERLRKAQVLSAPACVADLEGLLAQPLSVNGRVVRYRFAKQKARYVAGSINALAAMESLPETDRDLRDSLLKLPGIGPKTASWITRNWRGSDQVAIIDVHIHRACVAAGVFSANAPVASHYDALEVRFLEFADAIRCRASILDNLIWQTMRKIGHLLPGAPGRLPGGQRSLPLTAAT